MDESEKQELVQRLLSECILSEDEEDSLIIKSRHHDPIKPYHEILNEL